MRQLLSIFRRAWCRGSALSNFFGIDVAHCGRDAAFRHYRMGFAEQRFTNQRGLDALGG